MSYEQAVEKLVEQCKLLNGQLWVSIEDLKKAAGILDDNKK